MNIKRVQRLLNHSSEAVTMIYALADELTEEETEYFKRGRNSNSPTMSKNASPMDYMNATGFEALLGFLFLDNQGDRLDYIIQRAFEVIDSEQG